MKIIIDKIADGPSHSVSKKDIETIIKHIPKEWLGIKNVFRLSNQEFINSKWDRPVICNGVTYVISSRNLDRDFIIKELLIEIALAPTKVMNSVNHHHINKNDRKKLEEFIQPFYDKITAELK